MPTIENANDRLNNLTAQISTLTRTVSLGVLAVAWLFLSRSSEISGIPDVVSKQKMLVIAACSILAISFDLLQYVMGYLNVYFAKKNAKRKNVEVMYPKNVFRKARFFFFYAKICITVIAAIWMVIILAIAVTA